MEYVIIALAVCFAAGLTFFSGFGLGTIMLPIFSLFFPVPVAIAATAIVHFANNIFKFGLVYKDIDFKTLWKFGVTAILFALLGGYVLYLLGQPSSLYSYTLGETVKNITWLKISIGAIMLFFAYFELSPKMQKFQFSDKFLPLGGVLSGFFGGLSGHQGAFRSAFLSKANLTKAAFIATSNALALLIDFSRLTVYANTFDFQALIDNNGILITGILFAFLGTFLGKKLLNKTTIQQVQKIVGVLLFLMGTLLIIGLI